MARTADTHNLLPGSTPLIISVPHAGTALPPALVAHLTPLAQSLPDTDWYVDRLYDFAGDLGAALLVAHYSRYLVDLNRPPDDSALYQGATSTGLCPALSFSGRALYAQGTDYALRATEVQERRALYWQPYHDALFALIAATCARHGYAILLDAHSIRSEVPRLFAGRLPDINIGTNDAVSCSATLIAAVRAQLAAQGEHSWVIDGRFKGGYITRHYGDPLHGVHALQIELAQRCYLREPDAASLSAPDGDQVTVAPLRTLLRRLLSELLGQPLRALRVP